MTQRGVPHNAAAVPESSAAPPKPPDGATNLVVPTTTLILVGARTITRVEDITDGNSTGIREGEQNLTPGQQDAVRITSLQGGPTLTCQPLVFRGAVLKVPPRVQLSLHQSRHPRRHCGTTDSPDTDLNHITNLVSLTHYYY